MYPAIHSTNREATAWRWLLALSCWLVATVMCGDAVAAAVAVGNHTLAADRSSQWIPVMVTGGENVAGVDLFVQVGDGGPELVNVGLSAGTDGPMITSVQGTSGTIFAGTSASQVDHDRNGVEQVFFSSVVLSLPPPESQSVPADGVLARLEIDTTGIAAGSFNLLLSSVLPSLSGGPFDTTLLSTGGVAVPGTVTNGLITLVPAGSFTWKPGVAGNWNTATAWTPNGPPSPTDDAFIDSDAALVTVDDDQAVVVLTTLSDGRLHLESGGELTSPLIMIGGSLTGSGRIVGDVNNEGGIVSPGTSISQNVTVVPEPNGWSICLIGYFMLWLVLGRLSVSYRSRV